MSVLHCVLGVVCVMTLASAAAHAAPDDAASSRIEIDTLQRWDPARRDSIALARWQDAGSPTAQRTLPSSFADDGLRARWWWGRGAFELGAGADWLAPHLTATGARPLNQVVGVRASLSAHTRVVYETETALSWRSSDNPAGAGVRTSRVALEFKSKPSPVSNLRDGLLRVQLSGDAAVHFRPRSGGLQVMYRERF
jgi:hypothetical protein